MSSSFKDGLMATIKKDTLYNKVSDKRGKYSIVFLMTLELSTES